MATALVDKLHLAFEQVKKKNNLGVQFSLAIHLSEFCQGAQHCCCWCHTGLPALPLSPTAENGANTRFHLAEICGFAWQPTASELFSPPHQPRVWRGPMFHQHCTQAAHQALSPPAAMPHTVQGNGNSLFPFFFAFPESHSTRNVHGIAA